jgi:hypothetical protein
MKDVVTVEIDAPQATVAKLFADPGNNPKWMEDLARYEPLSGRQGMPGSTYRLAQQGGKLTFTATVLARDLPREVRLALDSPDVAVAIHTAFSKRADRTRLVSHRAFQVQGPVWADHRMAGQALDPPRAREANGSLQALRRGPELAPGRRTLRKAVALDAHDAEALPARRAHDDPTLQSLVDGCSQLFQPFDLGGEYRRSRCRCAPGFRDRRAGFGR